jgi:hypothetical protein
MRTESRLKGRGYLTSTVSVVLLGIPALKSAAESPLMLLCLLAGMGLSIAGMALRWRSHRLEAKKQEAKDSRQDHRDERQDRAIAGQMRVSVPVE